MSDTLRHRTLVVSQTRVEPPTGGPRMSKDEAVLTCPKTSSPQPSDALWDGRNDKVAAEAGAWESLPMWFQEHYERCGADR